MDPWSSPSPSLYPLFGSDSQVISCPESFPGLLPHSFSGKRRPHLVPSTDLHFCVFCAHEGTGQKPRVSSAAVQVALLCPHSSSRAPRRVRSVLLCPEITFSSLPPSFLAWISLQWPVSQLPIWTFSKTFSTLLLEQSFRGKKCGCDQVCCSPNILWWFSFHLQACRQHCLPPEPASVVPPAFLPAALHMPSCPFPNSLSAPSCSQISERSLPFLWTCCCFCSPCCHLLFCLVTSKPEEVSVSPLQSELRLLSYAFLPPAPRVAVHCLSFQ